MIYERVINVSRRRVGSSHSWPLENRYVRCSEISASCSSWSFRCFDAREEGLLDRRRMLFANHWTGRIRPLVKGFPTNTPGDKKGCIQHICRGCEQPARSKILSRNARSLFCRVESCSSAPT